MALTKRIFYYTTNTNSKLTLPQYMRAKKRKSNRSEGSSGGGWEIVYSGFVLILLCFFIMLSSFSTMEEAKVMQFVKSFASAISILPGGVKFEAGEAVLSDSPDMVDNKDKLAEVFDWLEELTTEFGLEDEINLSLNREGIVMRLSERALFNLGAADITAEALPLLEKVGSIISKTDYPVRIEGHTDNLPIHTERFPSNWELSAARAVNVLRYFIENHKINSRRLAAEGLSEFHPLVENNTLQNRSKNRRVEIIFLRKEVKKRAQPEFP